MKYALKIQHTQQEKNAGITKKRVVVYWGSAQNPRLEIRFDKIVDDRGTNLDEDNGENIRIQGNQWILSADTFVAEAGEVTEVEISNIGADDRESSKALAVEVHKERIIKPQPVEFIDVEE